MFAGEFDCFKTFLDSFLFLVFTFICGFLCFRVSVHYATGSHYLKFQLKTIYPQQTDQGLICMISLKRVWFRYLYSLIKYLFL